MLMECSALPWELLGGVRWLTGERAGGGGGQQEGGIF